MSVDRPTFSESWYRVADLKPRLRATAQTFRQHYRGRMWYVIRDPSNNQFFRLNQASYHFIALLDGRRQVSEVWRICNEQLGDRAPTQGEAIRLLGQLYTANLLQAELPADAQSMFERYRKRVRREMGGYFMNLLFPRIPLLNPEGFLNAFVGVVGWVFSRPGLLLWCVLVGAGFWGLTGQWDRLIKAGMPQTLLATDNLLLLYATFAVIKAIHEFGHAFACKKFGKDEGSGGEVHTMGLMLLVFMPTPYVDASSSWAFRSKWHRITVGVAGMYVEIAVAAVAAIIWAHTREGVVIHDIAYNAMFIASVSTVLFNANPLLRYDGYYMLSDLLEIPNLAQRGKEYLYYLVRKHVYGVRNPQSPAHSRGERFWFVIYALCSFVYRVFVSVAIMLFIADKLFFVGAVLAVASLAGWMVYPTAKFLHYLLTSEELTRTRGRAMLATAGFVVVAVALLGVVPFPDHDRAEGVVEAREQRLVHMAADGFIERVLPSGRAVSTEGPELLVAHNPQLESELAQVRAEQRFYRVRPWRCRRT
jgi:putative peptide zinc metalloprotease protein